MSVKCRHGCSYHIFNRKYYISNFLLNEIKNEWRIYLRFKLHKSHGTYLVEDDAGKIPLLAFTDLTTALRCLNELNNLSKANPNITNSLKSKQKLSRDR